MAALDLEGSSERLPLFRGQHLEQFHFLHNFAFVVNVALGALFEAGHNSSPKTFSEDGINQHKEEHNNIWQNVTCLEYVSNPYIICAWIELLRTYVSFFGDKSRLGQKESCQSEMDHQANVDNHEEGSVQ